MATSHSQMGHASRFLAACLASGLIAAPVSAQQPVGWSRSWQTASVEPAHQSRHWWSRPASSGHHQVHKADLGRGGYQYPSVSPSRQHSGYFRRSREASQSAASYALQQPRVSAAPPATRHTVPRAGLSRSGAFGGLRRFFSRHSEPVTQPPAPPAGPVMEGTASWYGSNFHGGPTASGERYDMYSFTAAHRTLPFGTLVKVTNLLNGRDVVVRINNRGPYIKGRILDLSKGAAAQIGMVSSGLAKVRIEIIGREG